MQLGRVVGTLVATRKNAKLEGTKLLLVQPVDPADEPLAPPVLAFDVVDAGVGDRVLLLEEGRSAQLVLERGVAAVDAAVVGVVDAVTLDTRAG
jgi:ethanolamine utilization protein EutN